MKVVKKIVIVIVIIILVPILILDYLRLNISYIINKDNFKETIPINGNKNKYIPQAIVYSDKYNISIQTSYNKNHKVNRIYIVDLNNNKLIKILNLLKDDKSINNTHVGGIATDNNTLWITRNNEVNEYSLNEIINTKEKNIISKKTTTLPIRGDFALYKNNILYIGDFCLTPFYKVKDNNPLLLAYSNNEINYNSPKYIISLPKMVQSMEIDNDNNLYFTTSFTYLINSKLLKYKNIFNNLTDTYKFNNNKIPYYKLTKKDLIKSYKLPPWLKKCTLKIINYIYYMKAHLMGIYLHSLRLTNY